MLINDWKVDRTGWISGPWDNEPDIAVWQYAGYHCAAIRNESGTWCAYVGVDQTHVFYARSESEIRGLIESPRDVNYADHFLFPDVGTGLEAWWIGWDFMHGFDICPRTAHLVRSQAWRKYRDLEFVKRTTNEVAEKLRALAA